MSIKKPHWGLTEIILVYLGMLAIGMLFSIFGDAFLDYAVNLLHIPDNELSYFVLSFAVQFITTVGLVLLLCKGRWRELGLRPAAGKSMVKYGILGGIILFIAISLMGYVIQHFKPDLKPQTYEDMLRSVKDISGFTVVFLIGAVLAPLSEELYFRGMMYPVFRNYLGPLGGAVVAGTIFGLSHWDLWRTIPLAIGGAALCYIYEKTGSILVSALAHGMWNGVMSLIIYLSIVKFG